MRKIKIESWTSKDHEGKDIKENFLMVLKVLITNKKPEEMPKGIEKFELFNRLSKAFQEAEKSNVLKLEEADYKFLKETINKDIPSNWGFNQNVSKAVENFMNAKEE